MPKNNRLPVIAAIPNYNMSQSLAELLPQVLSQGYNAVYVLDDNSADNSVKVAKNFTGVEVIAGKKNLGASGNRNRILKVEDKWPDAIIHFVDADMSYITKKCPAVIRRLMSDPAIGLLGGFVCNTRGVQSAYNFGPRLSLMSFITALPQHWAYYVTARRKLGRPTKTCKEAREWPDIRAIPIPQDTYYVLEGNMCIAMNTLAKIGGLHPTLRYHEAQDLSDRVTKAGLRVRFDPSLALIHLLVDVRGPRRNWEIMRAALQILRKNGWPLR